MRHPKSIVYSDFIGIGKHRQTFISGNSQDIHITSTEGTEGRNILNISLKHC